MRLVVLLLCASVLAAQEPRTFPHERVVLFGGKHFNPETTEKLQWTEVVVAPKDHFWSGWQDRWTLIRIDFEPNFLTVPTCLFYDLDAPDKVGQVFFPDRSQIGKEGITAKVRQGHTIKIDCVTVRPKIKALQACRGLAGEIISCEQ